MRVIDDQKKLHAMRRARTSDLRDSGIADTVKTKYKVEPGEVARALRQQIIVLKASSSSDIDLAFATLVERRADALMTTADTLFNNRRVQIVSLAARHAIPAIYVTRDWAAAGGLMSYGAYCPSCSRLNLNLSSTCKRPSCSASPCRQPCSPAPTM
jgi:hypothetical protein